MDGESIMPKNLSAVFLSMSLFISAAYAQNLAVDGFEGYTDDAELHDVWTFTKAGGPDGLFYYLDETKSPPEGSRCLELDVDMPEKWWYNTARRDLDVAPLDLNKYVALTFWFYGDSTATPGGMAFVSFLFDSQNRALRFNVPSQYVTQGTWQKVTLALGSYIQEQWDAGYGTDTPDAERTDVVAIGFMFVGESDNQTGTFYLDDIQFLTQLGNATVKGAIREGDNPLPGVTVYAIGQNSVVDTKTGADGDYLIENLTQGQSYHILPVKESYDFTPGYVSLTLVDLETTQDFVGVISGYNDLDTVSISDPFDESGSNPSILYRWATDWSEGEIIQVIDVTMDKTYEVGFPDAERMEAAMPGIPPNSLSGATSPKYAVEVGSSYGWDMLVLGRNTDKNYYVEVDVYLEVREDITNGYDRVSLGVRCSSIDPGTPALDARADSATNRSSGGYALTYESDLASVFARKYAASNDTTHAKNRLEGFAEDFGSVPISESGWHRFRIECLDSSIIFYVDGSKIAGITDTDYPYGPAGLHYRACYPDFAGDLVNAHHARFDNLKSGPTGAGVMDWILN